tara:strand:+ start:124 stop:1167 length:1044 start_codon:yes stop_codon:yes gene_type:complete
MNKKNHNIKFVNLIELQEIIFAKITNKDIFIIDKNLMTNQLIKRLHNKFKNRCLIIKGDEKIKSLETYSNTIEKLLKMGIQRKSTLISFGGGTIGDLSGFISATLLRGIDHIMVPTTLLAMVDSSIGGKTGINSLMGKNLIGSFYLPAKVFICNEFLKSLSKREMSCGFAEIIKYSFINPRDFNINLMNNNLRDEKQLKKIIRQSINTKMKFTQDFHEISSSRSARSILNFGHSVGHAIENSNLYKSSIKHGEAIAIGMIIEIKISEILGHYKKSVENMINVLKKYNLPTNYKKFLLKKNIKKIIKKIKFDKKSSNQFIDFICIDRSGGFVKKLSFRKLEELLNKID